MRDGKRNVLCACAGCPNPAGPPESGAAQPVENLFRLGKWLTEPICNNSLIALARSSLESFGRFPRSRMLFLRATASIEVNSVTKSVRPALR
jgi:hypothetical protein